MSTPKQQARIKRVSKIVKDGLPAIVEAIFDLEDKVEKDIADVKEVATESKLPQEILEKIRMVRGDQGEKGETGERGIQGEKGDKGDKGEDGKDGRDGTDGIHGLDGINGTNGKDGRNGVDGINGSPDMAEDIRNKLELLLGDERLDSKHIKGLEKIEDRLKLIQNQPFNPTMGPSFADIQLLKNRLTVIESTPVSGSGTVTTVSVASANGFAGSVTNASSTPAITVSTTINSPLLAGNGTAISAASTTGSGSTAVLATSPTLTTPTILNSAETQQTLTDQATVTWDMNSGGYAKLTLGGNRTIANPTNTRNGAVYILEIIAGASTPSWGVNFVWPAATAPTLTATGNRDIITFACSNGKLYGVSTLNFV